MKRGVKKRFITGLMAFAMILSQAVLPAQIAFAAPGGQPIYEVPTDGKISLCHRTNSASNPYSLITVSTSAADGVAGNSGNDADHYGEHKGPIASSEAVALGLKAQKIDWGDIIPPIPGAHSGYNWSSIGQAMLRNGCSYVTADATANITATPPTCDANGSASVTGLANATLIGSLDQTVGTHVATFTANTGHVFAGDTLSKTVEYTILAKLTGQQCVNPPTMVTPDVVVVDPCGTENDSVMGDAMTGVTYSVTQDGLSYTVIASPSSSAYALEAGNEFVLNENGTATLIVTLTNEECEVEPTSIPLPSGIADVCGRANDIVPTPTEGDNYEVLSDSGWVQDGDDAVKTVRTITYKANENYVFMTGEGWTLSEDMTEATYTFTDWGTKCPSANICTVSDNLFDSEWQYDGDTYPAAGGQGTFNFEPTGLYLNTPITNSYVYGLVSAGDTPIGDVDAMSYEALRLPQSAGYASTLPAYILYVDTNGLSVAGGGSYFVYEPYNNDSARAAVEGSFQLWDALDGGNAAWWMSGTGQALHTWDYFVNEYEDAVVVAYGFNQGTYNAETASAVQDITFDCATTSFTNEQTGGSGGGTPVIPTTPVVTTPASGAGAVLPAELPMTGENGSLLFTWIALLAAILTYGSVYYLQPKKRFEQ